MPRSSGGVLGRDFEREGIDANGEQFTLPCRVLVVSQDMAGLRFCFVLVFLFALFGGFALGWCLVLFGGDLRPSGL